MSGSRHPVAQAAFALLVLCAIWGGARAQSQELEFRPPASPLDVGATTIMRDLAVRLLPVYEEKNLDRFLTNLSAIQVIAGNYEAAASTRQTLRERRRPGESARADGDVRLLDIYVRALALERGSGASFTQTFSQSFRAAVTPLSDLDAFTVTGWRPPPMRRLELDLQRSFEQHRDRGTIPLADAVDLLWRYFLFDAFRSFEDPLRSLTTEDDLRRYVFDAVRIPGPGGTRIAAVIARPRKVSKPLPALLEFTVLIDPQLPVTEPAAHGYAGVRAYTRGRQAAAARVIPFQHDGDDARAVVQWIAKQSWNDQRVAMYGEGYSGFAAWAAAKRPPPELKAIATADPDAPGINWPMSGNIFQNAAYRWAQQVTGSRGDENDEDEDAAWRALDEAWYRSGRRYRDLEKLNKRPNRYFQRWLNHPSYDRFWQSMIPYREQFARIEIPVLTLSGYFSPRQAGALYYFAEHRKFNPQADHTLVLGPYAQASGDRPGALLRRLPVDPVARQELTALRYQWFDSLFKGGTRPALLVDRVNFEVMGANEWLHAGSLEAMGSAKLRFHLDAAPVTGGYLLARRDQPEPTSLRQQVALRERSDATTLPPTELLAKSLQTRHAVTYLSEPLASAIDIAGVLSGRLDLTTNKQDLDLQLSLYEQLQSGEFVKLFDPSATFRASYAANRAQRRLLKGGRRQQVAFLSERVTSRRITAGSRLVLVLGINLRPDQQINYGAGNDVSEESSEADGKFPLRVRWHSSSFIDVPVRNAP